MLFAHISVASHLKRFSIFWSCTYLNSSLKKTLAGVYSICFHSDTAVIKVYLSIVTNVIMPIVVNPRILHSLCSSSFRFTFISYSIIHIPNRIVSIWWSRAIRHEFSRIHSSTGPLVIFKSVCFEYIVGLRICIYKKLRKILLLKLIILLLAFLVEYHFFIKHFHSSIN